MTKYTEENQFTDDSKDEKKAILEDGPKILSKSTVVLLNLSWFGLSLMFLLLSVEVVPAQIHALVGQSVKGRWLGGIVAGGAGLMFFTSPVIGMLSDRLDSRFGRRRPVMVIGTLVLCVGLIGMGLSAPKVFFKEKTSPNVKITNSSGVLQCERDLVKIRCSLFHNQTNRLPPVEPPGSILIPEKRAKMDDANRPGDVGSLGLFIVFYLLVTTAFSGITVPYTALIADKSHPSQRGFNSGVMGAMILFGNVSGAAIGVGFMDIGVLSAYGCAIGIVLLTIVITVVTIEETPPASAPEPVGCRMLFCGFWDPLRDHDFRWVFVTKFLIQQGVSTVTGFLEYWLSDMIQLPNCWTPSMAVGVMLVPLLFAAAIGSIVFGIISDRIQRRKPIVMGAAFVMCVLISVIAGLRDDHSVYYIAVILAFFFGIAFGAYQAVDLALVMDVIPEEKEKAKDIAVWNQAMILPQALATPIGGVVLDGFERVNCTIGLGYIILFGMTAMYFLLSGLFITRIRSAR